MARLAYLLIALCCCQYAYGRLTLFNGVFLPTPIRFFIPTAAMNMENGLCKQDTDNEKSNNKNCMKDTIIDVLEKSKSKKDTDDIKVEADKLAKAFGMLHLAETFTLAPHGPVGSAPIGADRKSKLIVCYAATTVCKCKIGNNWCDKTISKEDAERSDGQIYEPNEDFEIKQVDGSTGHSLQIKADEYCRNQASKDVKGAACAGMKYARFWYARNSGGVRPINQKKDWRCFNYLDDEGEAEACKGDDGKWYECEKPDPRESGSCDVGNAITKIFEKAGPNKKNKKVEKKKKVEKIKKIKKNEKIKKKN